MNKDEMINTLIQRRNSLKDNVQLNKKEIASIVDDIKNLFFYDNDFQAAHTLEDIDKKLSNAFIKLDINLSVKDSFIDRLPHIQDLCFKDLESVYHGDPSCLNYTEIIVSYTAYYAILA